MPFWIMEIQMEMVVGRLIFSFISSFVFLYWDLKARWEDTPPPMITETMFLWVSKFSQKKKVFSFRLKASPNGCSPGLLFPPDVVESEQSWTRRLQSLFPFTAYFWLCIFAQHYSVSVIAFLSNHNGSSFQNRWKKYQAMVEIGTEPPYSSGSTATSPTCSTNSPKLLWM